MIKLPAINMFAECTYIIIVMASESCIYIYIHIYIRIYMYIYMYIYIYPARITARSTYAQRLSPTPVMFYLCWYDRPNNQPGDCPSAVDDLARPPALRTKAASSSSAATEKGRWFLDHEGEDCKGFGCWGCDGPPYRRRWVYRSLERRTLRPAAVGNGSWPRQRWLSDNAEREAHLCR